MLLKPEQHPDDLRRLLEALEPQMARMFVRFQIPRQDAEDLVQDSVVAFIIKAKTIQNPEAWLVGTLRNRCFLYWRVRRRQLWEAMDETLLAEVAGSVPAQQPATDVRQDLRSAIGRLPKRCQSILSLRYGLDCDNAEVAERLGYQPSSIRQITNRCIAALTTQLVAVGYNGDGNENGREPASLS
jgi:RNA polymerase sigma factor (sigma-70 family)